MEPLRDDFDKLENLLQQWVDNVRKECILNGFGILRTYGFTACWSEVSQWLEANPDKPIAETLDVIEHRLADALAQVLMEHSIVAGGSIALRTAMLEGLYLLQDVNDYETVISIIESCNEPVQTLSELLEFATLKPWADYISHITVVSPRLIRKIESLYRPRVDQDGDSLTLFESDDKDKALRVAKFVGKYPQSFASIALANSRPLGTPFNILIQDHKVALGQYEPMAPDQAALELMGLGLLGDIPFKDFSQKLKQHVDVVYVNLDFITKVDVRLDQLIAEVQRG